MAQVTYRGVSYDTEAYRKELLAEASKQRNFDLDLIKLALLMSKMPFT